MYYKPKKIIFVLILTVLNLTVLNAKGLLDDPTWDNNNQGKDSLCNNLFESILSNYFYESSSQYLKFDFYATGYLNDIDRYYVSYKISDSHTIDFLTEFFKIDHKTDISIFAYTKTEKNYYDSKPNHWIIQDFGHVDSFKDYLVFYDDKHLSVYRKSKYANRYTSISSIGNILRNNKDEEYSYDRSNKILTRKINVSIDNKTITESFMIKEGEIIELNK